MKTEKIKYQDGSIVLEGYFAIDESKPGKKPVVLVFHDWSGRNEFADQKAEELAKLGFAGFAVDMFGIGKLGKTNEEKMALMQPLADSRDALRRRALAGFEVAKKLDGVDSKKIAAMGFCFGGLCALDLAREGADLKGVLSFHGLLHNAPHIADKKILAKILAFHGHNDPMVKPDVVLAFEKEMTEANVDWQMHIFGGTSHAFTNPNANDHALGLIYQATAAKRSWIMGQEFLREIFA